MAIAVGVAIFTFVVSRGDGPSPDTRRSAKIESEPREVLPLSVVENEQAADGGVTRRAVYRYSVVPGGVLDGSEVARASERDPVVRAHYSGLRFGTIRPRRVAGRQMRYMSYRIGSRVYWTDRPVALAEGELILGDGVNEVRARCGNLLSSEPHTPTMANEPPPERFDEIEPNVPTVFPRGVPVNHRPAVPSTGAPERWLWAPGLSRPAILGVPPAEPPAAPDRARSSVPLIMVAVPPSSHSTPPTGTVDAPEHPVPDVRNPAPEGGQPASDPGGPGTPTATPPTPDPFVPPSDPWRPVTPVEPTPPPVKVPEPGSLLMLGVGGAVAALSRARRRR